MDGEGEYFRVLHYYTEMISCCDFCRARSVGMCCAFFSPFVLNMSIFIRSPAKLIYDESH